MRTGPVPQGGDHGFAGADAVAGEGAVGSGGGGELVQPAGDGGGEQGAPHPGGVDVGVAGGYLESISAGP